jgi:hypothetical protein
LINPKSDIFFWCVEELLPPKENGIFIHVFQKVENEGEPDLEKFLPYRSIYYKI